MTTDNRSEINIQQICVSFFPLSLFFLFKFLIQEDDITYSKQIKPSFSKILSQINKDAFDISKERN